MNTTAVVVPRLDLIDGRPVTTSPNVAEVFGKQHKNVLKAIARVKNDAGDEFARLNFEPGSYLDENNQPRPMFNITRDGFTLLAMGFTGKEAMRFKLAYIAAFNRMEAELMDMAAGTGHRRTDIHHHRGPVSESGLDIRYTLDLTKIVTRPTRASLAMFARLTGIDVSDILPVPNEEGGMIARFADECLVLIPDSGTSSRVSLADAYQRFLLWHQESIGGASLHSLKWLAARLREMGLTVQPSGGRTWIFGLRLALEVQS